MQAVSKRHSLYVQLLLLLFSAALLSVAVFFALNAVGKKAVEAYSESTDYSRQQDEKYAGRLQSYVTKNNLSLLDRESLDGWVDDQRILYLRMYFQGFLIYDSGYALSEDNLSDFTSDESTSYSVSNYYSIQFSDGTAIVVIFGLYDYQLSTWAFVAELAAAILLFFVIVLLGIRSKMNYILTLGKEIEILEGGNLDYQITVRGQDELAGLARGLDNMRISFAKQLEHEADMDRENKRAVTEMSHDLRTPLTSIMLYTELLKKGKYADEAQMQDYLDKIDKKAHQMRQMTENLFKYTLVTGEDQNPETVLEEPAEFKAIFYDPLSETLSSLAQMGFEITCDFAWPQGLLRVSTDYVMRILDNIVSNIQKYADPGAPVVISVIQKCDDSGVKDVISAVQKHVNSGAPDIISATQKHVDSEAPDIISVPDAEKSVAVSDHYRGYGDSGGGEDFRNCKDSGNPRASGRFGDSGNPADSSASNTNAVRMLGLRFENRTRSAPANAESTGVGLRSIRAMMEKMGGTCESGEIEGNQFRLDILFPCNNGASN